MKSQGTAMHKLGCIMEKLDDVISLAKKQREELNDMSKELDTLKSQSDTTIALETQAIGMLKAGSNTDTAALPAISAALKVSSDALQAAIGGVITPPVLSAADQAIKDAAQAVAVAAGLSTYEWTDSTGAVHKETVSPFGFSPPRGPVSTATARALSLAAAKRNGAASFTFIDVNGNQVTETVK